MVYISKTVDSPYPSASWEIVSISNLDVKIFISACYCSFFEVITIYSVYKFTHWESLGLLYEMATCLMMYKFTN